MACVVILSIFSLWELYVMKIFMHRSVIYLYYLLSITFKVPNGLVCTFPAAETYPEFISRILTFVCPWIISIIHNWWPTRCSFWFIYLYPISSTCFGQCFHPSSGALDCIYSFWYNTPMLLPAWRDGTDFHLTHDTSRQQHSNYIRSCKYSQVLLMMGENIARNSRAVWVQINKPKVASCWSSFTNYKPKFGNQYLCAKIWKKSEF